MKIIWDDLLKKHFEKEPRIREINRLHVGEICKCLRNSYYSFKFPTQFPFDVQKKFLVGELLHDFVGELLVNNLEKSYNFYPEQPIETEIVISDKIVDNFIVSGRCDGLLIGKDDSMVLEFKSTNFLNDSPQQGHVLQLQMYLGIQNYKKGCLVYFTKNDFDIKDFYIDFDQNVFDRLIEKAKKLHSCLVNNQLPDKSPINQYDCVYCKYKSMCEKNANEVPAS